MSEADDILAALLGEMGLSPTSPEPKQEVIKEDDLPKKPGRWAKNQDLPANKDRLPWPDTFLNGGDPADFKACHKLWVSVLANSIRDARSSAEKISKNKKLKNLERLTLLEDVHFVTQESSALRNLCDLTDTPLDRLVTIMKQEFFHVLNA